MDLETIPDWLITSNELELDVDNLRPDVELESGRIEVEFLLKHFILHGTFFVPKEKTLSSLPTGF